MNRRTLQRLLKSQCPELDSRARRVANMACSRYTDPRGTKAYEEMRDEFNQQIRVAKRSVRALKNLEKRLDRLEADINKALKADTESWCDVLREAHIPDDSPALLPIYHVEPTLKDYLRIRNIPDPAEPLERFLRLRHEVRRLAKDEADFVQSWILARVRPKKRSLALFSVSGALQYSLQRLFGARVQGRRLRKNEIEVRIARILNELDGGGPSIDSHRKDCAAVRLAIKRLSPSHKERCDKFLDHYLNPPRI